MTNLLVSKVDNNQDIELKRNNPTDAGIDIRSSEQRIVRAKSREIIKTGIKVAIPENYVGLLWSRSGLSAKNGIEVGAGCIDSSYRGELMVILYNHSDVDFSIDKGDRIAQLLVVPIALPQVEFVDSLDETERNEKGIGSSGIK